MVEFTLVTAVLAVLFLAVVQVGLIIHVRTTLVASAAEGARHAANANRSLTDGRHRTELLIQQSLSARFAEDVRSQMVEIEGVPAVQVTITTALPVIGFLGVDGAMSVAGHAVDEVPW